MFSKLQLSYPGTSGHPLHFLSSRETKVTIFLPASRLWLSPHTELCASEGLPVIFGLHDNCTGQDEASDLPKVTQQVSARARIQTGPPCLRHRGQFTKRLPGPLFP